eukprot:TRINITY_DN15581_c0_g1_i3.p2 TRINITY_DN15581_c0_g1~~TRINITY_DN15581_c0_g1_i3.p2  ORF type:complete len:128 (-),score=27.75 TRINITY_DN15581_c0_g1_i3:435-818(-)
MDKMLEAEERAHVRLRCPGAFAGACLWFQRQGFKAGRYQMKRIRIGGEAAESVPLFYLDMRRATLGGVNREEEEEEEEAPPSTTRLSNKPPKPPRPGKPAKPPKLQAADRIKSSSSPAKRKHASPRF